MSLVCCECDQDLAPSDSFPGREGGVLYPSVLAVAWVENEDSTLQVEWVPVFVEAPANASVCFECILRKAPQEAAVRMKQVCETYAAEIKWHRVERDQKGKWIPIEEASSTDDLRQQFIDRFESIVHSQCLHCGSQIKAQDRAFFTLRVIDKANCEKDLSVFGSYQWSNLETGMTSFCMCFACAQTQLPRTFKSLGYSLRGIDSHTGRGEGKFELFISPEVKRDLFGFTPN